MNKRAESARTHVKEFDNAEKICSEGFATFALLTNDQ